MDTNTIIAMLVAAELFLLMLMWAAALVFIAVRMAKREPKEKREEAIAEELAPEVSALREREREELKAEQAAFTKLMSYNTDMAYGIRTDTKERS